MKTKNILTLLALLIIAIVMSGCSFSVASTDTTPQDLKGSWTADGFTAEVTSETITVKLTGDDYQGLYWTGTFNPTAKSGDTIKSVADTEALGESIVGSSDGAKNFTYINDHLEFDFTALGETKTIKLERK